MNDTVAAKTLTGITINGIVVLDTVPQVCPSCEAPLMVVVAYDMNDDRPMFAVTCPKCKETSVGLLWQVQ